MLLELLVLSVAVVAIFQGQLLLRRGGPAQRTYALMLLGNGGLALVAFAARKADESVPGAELLAFLSVAVFFSLVFVPAILRDLARRALAADRVRLAVKLLAIRELFQPGFGARQEREFVEAIADVRAGRVDELLGSLRARRAQVEDPVLRRAFDERIVLTLLYARRWNDAIEHFERHLLREVDVVSPQLLVELVRAYGELSDLERAAELLMRLEKVPFPSEPVRMFLLLRARMVFLAFVGRAAEVERILEPAGPLSAFPASARHYWVGVARFHGGDREGAVRALRDAARLAGRDPRARELAAERLAEVEAAPAVGPRAVPAEVAELADQVARAALVGGARQAAIPKMESPSWRVAPVTLALVAVNVLAALLVSWRLGPSTDPAVLALAGANVKAAVRAGEWWRLAASTFLHVGAPHLILNMYGLWVLGKLVEQILGSLRYFALYTLSGVGGALASYAFGPEGAVSAGASGAVFGILGAAIAELALRRRAYPEAWRRTLLGNLVFLALANVAIGFAVPMIDQSAHLGGMTVGATLSAVLSPKSRIGQTRPLRLLAAGLAAVAIASTVAAWWHMSQRFLGASWRREIIDGISIEAPPAWTKTEPDVLAAPGFGQISGRVVLRQSADSLEEVADQLAAERLQLLAAEDGVQDGAQVAPSFEVPEGWEIREFRFRLEALGRRATFREAFLLRFAGSEILVLQITFLEDRLEDLRPIVPRLVASARPAE